ncbi:MAG TPA: DUF6152 family protein [Bryobacteraceae bacterium]|jgi:hypothetical protein|nr:DUF6152 family protein [Bryobacteraceae bacterium]
MRNWIGALVLPMLLAAGPLIAHHSAAAEYEAKLTTRHGTVTRVQWMNPHVWIYIDVKDAHGAVIHTKCEGSAPNGLIANGWSRESLKPGDQVTIEGYAAKGRPDGFKIRTATLPDGRRLVMGLPLEVGH